MTHFRVRTSFAGSEKRDNSGATVFKGKDEKMYIRSVADGDLANNLDNLLSF
jgi:hypothetical protein